jgi:hypothetical protein
VHVFGADPERGVGVIAANLTARPVTVPMDGRQALVVPPFGIATDFPPAT